MRQQPDDRRYAVGYRGVSAPPVDPFKYLTSASVDAPAIPTPQFIFTHAEAQKLGVELARQPFVGTISVQSKPAAKR